MDADAPPPHDLDAERGVLGGLLLSLDLLSEVLEVLDTDDFYDPRHQAVFETILTLFNSSQPVDPLTVSDALLTAGALERIGGQAYLHDLITAVPSPASAGYYARIVARHATRRRVRVAALRILADVDAGEAGDVDDLISSAQAEVFAIGEGRSAHGYTKLGVALESALARVAAAAGKEELRGVSTGFRGLDHITGGLRPSQLVVVAARPSIGKSTLALDLARHAAIRENVPTAFFTLEMDAEDVTMRLMSAETHIPITALDRGTLTPEQWQTVAKAAGPLASTPLFIDDSPRLSVASMRAKCRKIAQQHGLGLVIVDYLQLLAGTQRGEWAAAVFSDSGVGGFSDCRAELDGR